MPSRYLLVPSSPTYTCEKLLDSDLYTTFLRDRTSKISGFTISPVLHTMPKRHYGTLLKTGRDDPRWYP